MNLAESRCFADTKPSVMPCDESVDLDANKKGDRPIAKRKTRRFALAPFVQRFAFLARGVTTLHTGR